jgi:hypothetical protein
MMEVFDDIENSPHPEEAAKQLSRRTHPADPAEFSISSHAPFSPERPGWRGSIANASRPQQTRAGRSKREQAAANASRPRPSPIAAADQQQRSWKAGHRRALPLLADITKFLGVNKLAAALPRATSICCSEIVDAGHLGSQTGQRKDDLVVATPQDRDTLPGDIA